MPLYEFDKYESNLNKRQTAPTEFYVPFRNASRRAFLLWGEHCTECAAPACYTTCDLYQARPDLRCRRFEFGIFANPAFPSGYNAAAEVFFKRWGVLTARGNATMLPAFFVHRMEQVVMAVSPCSNLLGRLLYRIFKNIRFSYLTFGLLERFNHWLRKHNRGLRPEAFVFECYNPQPVEMVVRLQMGIDSTTLPKSARKDQLPPPFAAKLIIPHGYFRKDIPLGDFEQIIETGLPFEINIIPDAGEGGTHLVFLTLDFVIYARPEMAQAGSSALSTEAPKQPTLQSNSPSKTTNAEIPAAKCVVFDLDNTLWSGVLLEGEVNLKPGVQNLLATLDSRGILLSIASKNSWDHAKEKLVALGIEEYFLYPQINWGRKSDSLKSIAKNIDIGIDTLILIEDNPFERDEVSQALPQVEVLDETWIARLLDHPRLKGSSSSEAKIRRQFYRQAMVRSVDAREFGDDYLGFLESCKIKLIIRAVEPADIERVFELAQRTNQLNFSGTKYKDSDLFTILENKDLEKYVLECSDKYGSYGIIGFCVAKRSPDTVYVTELMLSCRVQGKFIERALFDDLVNRSAAIVRIQINFKKTTRNTPAQSALEKLGFDIEQDGVLTRDVSPGDFAVNFMSVVSSGGYAAKK